jgi:hypothetical protein
LFPQLPQVSHGDSSTRLITVALPDVTGVGVGTGVGAGEGVGEGAGEEDGPLDVLGVGVGAGKTLAVVEVEMFPPQATSAKVTASIREQR